MSTVSYREVGPGRKCWSSTVVEKVEIASLCQAVQKLLPHPFLRPPSWISGGRRRIFSKASIPIEKPVPKNGGGGGGRHRIGVSSLSVGEGRRVQCASPHRCLRYKKGPAVLELTLSSVSDSASCIFAIFCHNGGSNQNQKVGKTKTKTI